MKLIKFFAMVILLTQLAACSSSRVTPSSTFVTFEVAAENVKAINVGNAIKVIYTQAPESSVRVEAPDNVVDYVSVKVKGDKLDVGLKPHVDIAGSSKVTVYVSSPSLKSVDASSASYVGMPAGLKTRSEINIEASSSATISISDLNVSKAGIEASSAARISVGSLIAETVNAECRSAATMDLSSLDVRTISAEATSAATMSLSGRCDFADLEANSAATIKAKDLAAARGRANSNSAGSIKCNVSDVKIVDKSTSGRIENFAR